MRSAVGCGRESFGLVARPTIGRRFPRRFLTYHLGRELSQPVSGNGRFADPAEHDAFVSGLDQHCREAALIVRDFAGGWYSKANFQGGITPVKARNFAGHALKTLRAELRVRGSAMDNRHLG